MNQFKFNLKGKTALITGASSGLGEQAAKLLSENGVRVILAARSLDKLTNLANILGNAAAIEMDVRDRVSVKKAFAELEAMGEKIDICINNAGIAKLTPVFEDDEEDEFQDVIQTNVMGVWYVAKDVANHMKNHKIQGSIINIGSVRGANSFKETLAAYCVSKAAVAHLTKAVVGELSRHKIRINTIAPGLFHTPLTNHKLDTKIARKQMEDSIPLGFAADPGELDGAILYLASNEASRYVTGSCITVDGGISWGGNIL
jgi:NAD(P)-dependent dehydrogenase (short-subunit alcohol dehydrogenase family)